MRWPWSRSRPEPGGVARGDDAVDGGVAPGRGAGGGAGGSARKLPAKAARDDDLHLVQVAYAANLPEAELIQNLLRQEGIPSMVRRNGAFDLPDYLAAGGRDILVPASQADRARELLA